MCMCVCVCMCVYGVIVSEHSRLITRVIKREKLRTVVGGLACDERQTQANWSAHCCSRTCKVTKMR